MKKGGALATPAEMEAMLVRHARHGAAAFAAERSVRRILAGERRPCGLGLREPDGRVLLVDNADCAARRVLAAAGCGDARCRQCGSGALACRTEGARP